MNLTFSQYSSAYFEKSFMSKLGRSLKSIAPALSSISGDNRELGDRFFSVGSRFNTKAQRVGFGSRVSPLLEKSSLFFEYSAGHYFLSGDYGSAISSLNSRASVLDRLLSTEEYVRNVSMLLNISDLHFQNGGSSFGLALHYAHGLAYIFEQASERNFVNGSEFKLFAADYYSRSANYALKTAQNHATSLMTTVAMNFRTYLHLRVRALELFEQLNLPEKASYERSEVQVYAPRVATASAFLAIAQADAELTKIPAIISGQTQVTGDSEQAIFRCHLGAANLCLNAALIIRDSLPSTSFVELIQRARKHLSDAEEMVDRLPDGKIKNTYIHDALPNVRSTLSSFD